MGLWYSGSTTNYRQKDLSCQAKFDKSLRITAFVTTFYKAEATKMPRKNSLVPLPPWVNYIARHERERIETVFSQIISALERKVHAVTPRGFELKTFLTMLAYTLTATL